ncbi:ATPase, T2SS/T4P/T4SS family [Candidatus Absconditicoccus praedator]|uniref:ATPase, T2SS/T4P/T4SS family n=1 Tax=Candidatus Absconditicoccus praedator TaxID=2735562 RepID=UPI001E36EBA6|nr:ATPase, T2SS/T4P/T4SS family [Candidatus Absconditicoccus praedator]UFX82704.1 Flp pilus assembly complex ATPase component TadA [Candidatus Absconditicoccus praedator]
MEKVFGEKESILDNFFEEGVMSVHFKENVHIIKKIGKPGGWETKFDEEVPSKNYLNNIINQLYKEIQDTDNAFLEIDKNLSKVLQIGPYRIVIVLPPLSDGIEITAVKPVKKLNIQDYNLDDDVLNLLQNQAQGILISGSPGEGKTTFAQALIEMFVKNEKIVKTIESPRDLLVPNDVTQYSFSYAPHNEIRDILLLSRPDYTVYDEVRNVDDFNLFKDLRLTGIGLVGVIHATNPVDSIQRFLGTIEMGIVPQVVDTVIFVKGGSLDKILKLKYCVKVPEGMESSDLARPVIQIYDFFSEKVEYEIYSYGEQTVVMPTEKVEEYMGEKQSSVLLEYGSEQIQNILQKKYNFPVKVKPEGTNSIKLYVPEKNKGSIIGKQGAKISELEKQLGISISVRTTEEVPQGELVQDFNYEITKKNKKETVLLYFPIELANVDVVLQVGDEKISLTPNKKGKAQIKNKELIDKIKVYGVNLDI